MGFLLSIEDALAGPFRLRTALEGIVYTLFAVQLVNAHLLRSRRPEPSDGTCAWLVSLDVTRLLKNPTDRSLSNLLDG